jgi:hypothetical protein|tara:strand:- start:446 stop:1519 length:1074 start_codon:yes stop_codon:yes gene_type:complete
MMIQLKEAYENNAILKRFPKPDYSHISPDIKISEAEWIPFKNIYIDDVGNIARLHGSPPGHIAELKYSFGRGVQLNQPVGAVMKRPLQSDGTSYPKPYELKYGYGRTLAQIELNHTDGWAFNVITANETQWEDIQSFENEDTLPKAKNKEADIINLKTTQVNDGRLPKKEGAIIKNLYQTYPGRKKESIVRIAAGIFENTGVQVKYQYYTDAKIKLWRDNHYSGWFEVGGNFHKKINEHGFTSKIGGLYRTWHRALNICAETGKHSYVNCFTDTVTKGSTLIEQREKIKEEYIRLCVNHILIYGKNVKFLRLNGLFPQAWGQDNWKKFIKFDQEKIDKLINLEVKRIKTKPIVVASK